jgi:dolichyl-phosphate-mannose--protein O-mannosyl transferase
VKSTDKTDFDALVIGGKPRQTAAGPPAPRTSPRSGPQAAAHAAPQPWLDRVWARLATTPERARALSLLGPFLVTLLATITRLWDLGSPHSLVFDETFYVKDAWTLSHLGYESEWPNNPNPGFESGNVNSYLTDGEFVVHPPLGKWLISFGMMVLGANNSVSWRISTALIGILAVVLLMVIAKGLFGSTLVATIAGLLMAIDGNAIVMSRVSLLDNFVMFFALLGFGAVLLDRHQSAGRLALWIERRGAAGRGIDWGPALWRRPWLVAAGISFGLASAVKWNGLYFLAGFAIYTLIVDAVSRKHAGVPFWVSGTIWKQGPVTFLLTVPIGLATYLASFTGWFVTRGGYDRLYALQAGNAWTGTFAWVPKAFQSFVKMQYDVYYYNINDHSPHPYQSNPLTWLFMTRPTSMYFQGDSLGQNGCTVSFCGSAITGIANPIIWYAGTAAAFYLLYRLIRYHEWRVGLILAGLAAGYLPWLLYINRTIFQFYTIAFEPYLILAIAFVAWKLLGARGDPLERRQRGIRIICVYLVVAIGVSIFFWPMWTGMQIDYNYMLAHYWLASWK